MPKNKGKKIDPICGMKGHIAAFDHYFCSQHCVKEYEKKHLKKRKITDSLLFQIVFYLAVIFIIGLGIGFLHRTDFMLVSMGVTFIIVSILKMIDLKGFAIAFSEYDLFAKKSTLYAHAYPFIELTLGVLFFFSIHVTLAAAITTIIMTIGIVGVTQNLLAKNPVRCACLGTWIKLPLTKFTFFEDAIMLIMALLILFGF